jgi:hypothetical protein
MVAPSKSALVIVQRVVLEEDEEEGQAVKQLCFKRSSLLPYESESARERERKGARESETARERERRVLHVPVQHLPPCQHGSVHQSKLETTQTRSV